MVFVFVVVTPLIFRTLTFPARRGTPEALTAGSTVMRSVVGVTSIAGRTTARPSSP